MVWRTINKYALTLLFLLLPNLLWAAPPSRSYTYTEVAPNNKIRAAEVTTNEDNIFNYLTRGVDTLADNAVTTSKILDGTITNADIDGAAGIVDTKFAQITTASKVSGTALTGLASVPSAAGALPVGNGGTGVTAAANTVGGIVTLIADWTDYFSSSTIVGWSASPTGYIYTKKIGKTVFVDYYITGTSNSGTTTFTVPYTSASAGFDTLYIVVSAIDNGGTRTAAIVAIGNSVVLVNLYKNAAPDTFTASGTKTVQGQFWYESAS